jgi:hypothetical protein
MKIQVIWDIPRADYQIVTGISDYLLLNTGNYLQSTSCQIPEVSNLHHHSCENFKFHSSLNIYRSKTNYG